MDVRRIAAVAALPCLCLTAAKADAQSRNAATYRPIGITLPTADERLASDQRLIEDPAPVALRGSGMLGTLVVDDNAEIGVGRFGVGSIPRRRTNMERERLMERENRNIAGAGMRIRF